MSTSSIVGVRRGDHWEGTYVGYDGVLEHLGTKILDLVREHRGDLPGRLDGDRRSAGRLATRVLGALRGRIQPGVLRHRAHRAPPLVGPGRIRPAQRRILVPLRPRGAHPGGPHVGGQRRQLGAGRALPLLARRSLRVARGERRPEDATGAADPDARRRMGGHDGGCLRGRTQRGSGHRWQASGDARGGPPHPGPAHGALRDRRSGAGVDARGVRLPLVHVCARRSRHVAAHRPGRAPQLRPLSSSSPRRWGAV